MILTRYNISNLEWSCASVSKRVIVQQNLLCENEFELREKERNGGTTFSYAWCRTQTRFDNEAKGSLMKAC